MITHFKLMHKNGLIHKEILMIEKNTAQFQTIKLFFSFDGNKCSCSVKFKEKVPNNTTFWIKIFDF